jgi:hypothetical protein
VKANSARAEYSGALIARVLKSNMTMASVKSYALDVVFRFPMSGQTARREGIKF